MSDSNQDGGGDDLSGLTSFFFYVFIVHPCTAWILRPGRFPRKTSIMYAIGFLALLAAIKTGWELNERGPNYYSTLGVTRNSNPLEIKRAYKKLSLQLHPDKNPSPTALDEFDNVKQAYDVLMDMELREVYNKFGKDGIKSNKRYDETQFLIEVGIFYITWGMMAFMLTLGKRSGDARNWVFTGLVVMLVLEIALVSSPTNPLPSWFFPTWTVYECVWLMHALFPAFMNGCRSLGSFLYIDFDAQQRQLLLALQDQSKDILLVLRDVQIGVQAIAASGGGPVNRLANAANSTGGDTTTTTTTAGGTTQQAQQPVTTMMRGATPTGKIAELQKRLQSSNTNVARAAAGLGGAADTSKGGNSNFGFYAMILGYIAISYLFSK